jgi:hypothetical protein
MIAAATHQVTSSGFVRPLPPPPVPMLPRHPAAADLFVQPVVYHKLPTGLVQCHDGAGSFLGLYTDRDRAERTVAFLTR